MNARFTGAAGSVVAVMLTVSWLEQASASATIASTVRGIYIASNTGTAVCNAGEVAVGGGAGVDNPGDAYLGRSEPSPNSGTPTGWTAFVKQRSTGNASSGSAFAICATGVTATVRGTYIASNLGTALCNAGEVAVGGGAGVDNPADAYLGRSEPSPNSGTPTGWSAVVRQRSTGNASSGSAYAICATGVTATVRGTYIASNTGTTVCHAGEILTGGGAGVDNPADAYLGRSEPSPNNGTPTGWTAFVKQRSTGNASSGSAYAICVTPPASSSPTPTAAPTTTPTITPTTVPTTGPTTTPTTTPTPPPDAVPPGTPSAHPKQTASVAGARLKLATPKTCVRPGAAFRSTLTAKKLHRNGARFVKVRRVDFFVNGAIVRSDRKAPFSLRLFVDSSKRGKTLTLRARAYIKVRRGTSAKKSITVRFQVCSS